MRFGGLQKCSTIDFPGELACVLFVRGCDLDCFYCHNRELLDVSGDCIQEADILSFLERRRGRLSGVVVSGGEPTIYPDLPDFLRRLRALGFKLKLDTSGSRPEHLQALLAEGLLDYVALDLKAPQGQSAEVCGREEAFTLARESLARLLASGLPFEGRSTLYPGLSAEGLLELASALPPLPCYSLQLFRPIALARMGTDEALARPALKGADVAAIEGRLRQVQPNLKLLW